jgi:hypothetical protein
MASSIIKSLALYSTVSTHRLLGSERICHLVHLDSKVPLSRAFPHRAASRIEQDSDASSAESAPVVTVKRQTFHTVPAAHLRTFTPHASCIRPYPRILRSRKLEGVALLHFRHCISPERPHAKQVSSTAALRIIVSCVYRIHIRLVNWHTPTLLSTPPTMRPA